MPGPLAAQSLLDKLRLSVDDDSLRRVQLSAGEDLTREGDHDDSVYILLEGRLDVTRRLNGTTATIATLEDPGSIIGEMVTLAGGARTATVTSMTDSDLVSMTSGRFASLLRDEPEVAKELASLAVRRAEEGELVEILSEHFGMADDEFILTACNSVEWVSLRQGETLTEQGDPSDAVYFVIRGRLQATRTADDGTQELLAGELGRGELVGEVGVLSNSPRTATLRAVRDSVVASMKADVFVGFAREHPRLLIELTLQTFARSERHAEPSSSVAILAFLGVENVDDEMTARELCRELSKGASADYLTPRRVDEILGTPGIAATERGGVGDVRVSKLLHEMELEVDHLVLDVGRSPGPWARRALGLADRVVIFIPENPSEPEIERVSSMLQDCPGAVGRTVVLEHRSTQAPRGSVDSLHRLGGDELLHTAAGSRGDLARVARVSAGKGTALILSGGGGRGFAHLGVYRALIELGVDLDIYGGSSIGGVLGTVMADATSPDQIESWAQEHFPKVLDYTLPVVSLIKGGRIAKSALQTFEDREIQDLWRTFFCLSTDLTSSAPHIHRVGSVALAIRATSAIPGVMPPVPLGDALLIDGGVLNNLPIDIARSLTPRGQVIAVDVAPPRGPGAHGDYGLSVSGWDALRAGRKRKRSPYPGISAVLMRSMITASMAERDRQVAAGLANLYLDLDIRGTSMLDFGDPISVARRGYEASMPQIEAWLTSRAVAEG